MLAASTASVALSKTSLQHEPRFEVVESHAREEYFYNKEKNAWIRYGVRFFVICSMHPFDYAKTLMQLGYEPISPIPISTIRGYRALRLPSAFSYLGLIRKTDGTTGFFRGLTPKIIGSFIGMFFTERLVDAMGFNVALPPPPKQTSGTERMTKEQEAYFKAHIKRDLVITATGTLITYPLRVIAVRMMAQFVGRETLYNTIWGSIKEIYGTEGVLGFYHGFVPFLISEVGAAVLTGCTVYLARKYGTGKSHVARKCNTTFVQFIYNCLMYPFEVVSTCMATTRSRLQAGNIPVMPVYVNWIRCLKDLYNRSELMRGSYLFWRTIPRTYHMLPSPVQLPYMHAK